MLPTTKLPAQPSVAAVRRGRRGPASGAAAGASWMALVAATTLGVSGVQWLRAEVSLGGAALPRSGADEYRLIVQSYSATDVVDGVPSAYARPIGSAQRSVTPAELARGIAIDLVEVGGDANHPPVVVAWFERGSANLDFDARRARPGRDAYIGTASTLAAPLVADRDAA